MLDFCFIVLMVVRVLLYGVEWRFDVGKMLVDDCVCSR